MRSSCFFFLLVCFVSMSLCQDPQPPVWSDFDGMWNWLDSDHKTILSRHQFHFGFTANVRTVNGHFYESGNTDYTKPMGGYANFTQQKTIRYYPPYGLFGTPQPCVTEAWDRTIRYDAYFNNLGIPDNYTYVGQKTVKGVKCNGWNFLADNDGDQPGGNTMWTAIPAEYSDQRPIWMDIIWNSHAIDYTDWHLPPLTPVAELQSGMVK
eukprot:CAMPEP_0201524750 /NCGR_PEP_ID=MMETSP0161_2-20130828/24954_1 /ASSEMBLY_ACC=CAM_ASM_000251 /TAXON_ID=180227 /ORGANISM="Neoparamoeba aestuarina, Strain SoJaBio B1-5/56/2" /LENGTH=207 /DNA_ID=CAMNT_0047924311 /DNA_START=60 /DNA_END=680 /DNA_ORIENTATION=-